MFLLIGRIHEPGPLMHCFLKLLLELPADHSRSQDEAFHLLTQQYAPLCSLSQRDPLKFSSVTFIFSNSLRISANSINVTLYINYSSK